MSDINYVTLILLGFSFIPLILSEFAKAKSLPSIDDFFICSRKMSSFLAFFTIYGTWYSTFAVVGSSTHFYSNGPVYMTSFAWNALFAVCVFIIGRRLWFLGKTHHYITPADFFKDIYKSKFLSVIVTAVILVFTIPYTQIQFSGSAYLIEIATGGAISWKMAGMIFYIVMIVYTWSGGIRAVAYTDVFLSIIVFFTMIVTGVVLTDAAGGVENIFETLVAEDPDSVIISGENGIKNTFLWITMFIITPLGAIMSPPMWLRSYSVEKEKTFYLLPFLITIATIGYIGSFLAGNAGRVLDSSMNPSDTIIPNLVLQYGSQFLAAILFCGFSAASLSTANSQIHALATVYVLDVHKAFINKNASDKSLLFVAKCSILGFSALTYGFMIFNPSIIVNTGLLGLSGTAQLLIPVLGALFWKRSNSKGACAGIITGVITLAFLYFKFNLETSICGAAGLLVNLIIFVSVCLLSEQDLNTRNRIIKYQVEFRNRNSSKTK